ASVIRMMSHAMTEEVFHKGLQQYLKSNALGNADSNDLFRSLQKALDESGIKWKQPVQVIMYNWVEYPGYPTLTVKRVKQGYQLTQEHFVIVLMKVIEYPTRWWIPITYVEESNPNFKNTTPVDWFAPEQESRTVPSEEKKGWFIFNTKQTGYYRVNYDVENWELLIKELNKGNETKIHVLNRAQMIDDAFNLARVNSLNYTVALNLALYLTHEVDYMPWQPAFRHLSFLKNLLRNSEKYHTFTEKINVYMHFDSVLLLIKNRVDVDLKKEILCTGVRNANESAWADTLRHINESALDTNNKKDQLTVLACSNSSEILTQYLDSSLDPDSLIDFGTAVTNV
ncbi:aminopeptidase N-like, partial [Ceratina calcarata]|uniref:Aminopeptidase N-like n=1 Tax=Ceratina calcarata TaxID=156304 RepID=A0AAJ7NDI9_9HYME